MSEPLSYCFHQAFAEPVSTGLRSFELSYLLYATSGSFTLDLADRRWLLPPQRAALIAPGTMISVTSTGPATTASVLFAPIHAPLVAGSCSVFTMNALARAMVAHAARWGAERAPTDAQADRFFAALGDIVAALARNPEHSWLPRASSPQITRALALIDSQLDTPLPIATLAKAAALSERTLLRRFDDELQMTPGQYAARARMILAMERLLASRDSVTTIALATGFEGTSAFIRAFRRFTGTTPLRYRANRG